MKPNELRELGRSQYEPSLRVDWARMKLQIVLGLIVAVQLGVGLWYLQSIQQRFILVNGIGAALIMVPVAMWMVKAGHCRNPQLALWLGLAMGTSTIVVFHQAQLVEIGGWQLAYRIDLLPSFIWYTFHTQEFRFEKAGGGPFEFQFIGNIVVFCIESFMLLGIPAASAEQTARLVYSEQTHRWAKWRFLTVQPEVALGFDRVLWNDQLVEYLPQVQCVEIPDPKKPPPHSTLVLYYFDNDPTSAYLTVRYNATFTMLVVSQLQLTPAESDACRRLFGLR